MGNGNVWPTLLFVCTNMYNNTWMFWVQERKTHIVQIKQKNYTKCWNILYKLLWSWIEQQTKPNIPYIRDQVIMCFLWQKILLAFWNTVERYSYINIVCTHTRRTCVFLLYFFEEENKTHSHVLRSYIISIRCFVCSFNRWAFSRLDIQCGACLFTSLDMK